MTDETVRPATAPETVVPVAERPAAGGASLSGPSTANSAPASRTPRTTMTDTVVARIAGIAASGVPGVHRLGGPLDRAVDRAVDGVRRGLPGLRGPAEDDTAPDTAVDVEDTGRGVSVVVGEREASVSVELTVEFGARVEEVAAEVRREISAAVERMTELRVREVDVRVADVHVPAAGPSDGSAGTPHTH